MRKYKQVKEKKVTYDLDEWEEVERRAAKMHMKTGTYIKRVSVDKCISYCDMEAAGSVVKAINAVGNNVNQLARKANEINSIYAEDIEKLELGVKEICRIVSSFLSTGQWGTL
ncbi:MAG: plasmid mobilization relaxosome protein MobC [Ruminiclostridium sp.]|nr:plasmid mobilization relaxosome protein MobC [Ruminiclostridium sp.]